MSDWNAQLTQYQGWIEDYLTERCFVYDSEPQQKLFEAMRYSLLAGGKRLRPVLVFEFCRLCGGVWQEAAPFAAAVEMVHTYSLIHDDLPCMDNDDYRRGRLTSHKVFGEATAVLAGDGLLTAAFSRLVQAPYSAETRLQAVEVLSGCAGELGMVGGQMLDMESEQRACTEAEILDIQTRKTGALIRAACLLGVLAGSGDEQRSGPLRSLPLTWAWRSRSGTTCWMWWATPRLWARPWGWTPGKTPLCACTAWRPVKPW